MEVCLALGPRRLWSLPTGLDAVWGLVGGTGRPTEASPGHVRGLQDGQVPVDSESESATLRFRPMEMVPRQAADGLRQRDMFQIYC